MHARLALLVWGCVLTLPLSAEPPQFEFRDGDRVVLLGGTLFERDIDYGYIETALTAALPNVNLTIRNLGWSGETVGTKTSDRADPSRDPYQRRLELVREQRPTVVFLAFGGSESMAGEAGLPSFVAQYEKLLDDLAPLGCRLALLTPHQFETPSPPLPDAAQRNPTLGLYAQAIRDLAQRRRAWLIDLYDRTELIVLSPLRPANQAAPAPEPPRGFAVVEGLWKSFPRTEDGVHLSPYGDLRAGRVVVQQLRLTGPEFLVQLDSDGAPESLKHAAVSDFHSDGKQASFRATLSRLPEPPTPEFPKDTEYFVVAGGGLPSGKYALKVDGAIAAVNPSRLVGFPVRAGADFEQAEHLRQTIVVKNQLCRLQGWQQTRPKGPVVPPELLERLIANAEETIARLKTPVPRRYEIVPRDE